MQCDHDVVKSHRSQNTTGINLNRDEDQKREKWNEDERVFSLNTFLFLHLMKNNFHFDRGRYFRYSITFSLEMQNDLILCFFDVDLIIYQSLLLFYSSR